jgi:hypothetical protein
MEIGFRGFLVHRQLEGEAPSRELRPGSVQLTTDPIRSTTDGLYRYLDSSAPPRSRLEYFLEAIDDDGHSELFGPIPVTTGEAFSVPAWPNPFRDSVNLGQTHGDPIDIDVYDASGRLVRSLASPGGREPLIWDGRATDGEEVPTGVYFARPQSGVGETVRLIRLK